MAELMRGVDSAPCTHGSWPMMESRARRLSELDTTEDLQPMFELNGYQFLSILGEGGQSTVYRVRSLKYRDYFAAKILRHGSGLENNCEFQAMRALGHAGIVPCFDAFSDGEHVVLVYEYCRGGTLQDLINEQPVGLSYCRFREIASQLVQALAFVHKSGFAHGDVKTTNALFVDSERQRIKLTDFGLSTREAHARTACGTPAYQCPEIWQGRVVDALAADVWALGVCFCVMLQKTVPWVGATAEDRVCEVMACEYALDCPWQDIASVVKQMLVPEERRITMAALAAMPLFTPRATTTRSRLPRPVGMQLSGVPLAQESRRLSASRLPPIGGGLCTSAGLPAPLRLSRSASEAEAKLVALPPRGG